MPDRDVEWCNSVEEMSELDFKSAIENKNDSKKDIHKFGIPLVMVQQKLGHYSLLFFFLIGITHYLEPEFRGTIM